MKADAFLSRCEKVRSTGDGRWVACCPAHPDKNPSMTVRELEDGRVLVHCFGGCDVEQILSAVGLTFDALFPDRPPQADHTKGERRPFPVGDVFEAVASDVFYVAYMAGTMASGYTLEPRDKKLLEDCYNRLMEAHRLALGGR